MNVYLSQTKGYDHMRRIRHLLLALTMTVAPSTALAVAQAAPAHAATQDITMNGCSGRYTATGIAPGSYYLKYQASGVHNQSNLGNTPPGSLVVVGANGIVDFTVAWNPPFTAGSQTLRVWGLGIWGYQETQNIPAGCP